MSGDNVIRYNQYVPCIDDGVWIAPNACVIGNVNIGSSSSVWFSSCIRGDEDKIAIGECTNIQDCSVVHVTDGQPTIIGDRVTIGHSCIIHGASLRDECLIGMGSIIMDGAVIGRHSFIGAGALVTTNTIVGEGELWLGSPAKKIRMLSDKEIGNIIDSAFSYATRAEHYSTS